MRRRQKQRDKYRLDRQVEESTWKREEVRRKKNMHAKALSNKGLAQSY